MEAQHRALLDQQRRISEQQRKHLEGQIKAAIAAHVKAMAARHKEAMEQARLAHEAHVKAAEAAARAAAEARRRAITAQERASVAEREREAREAHARAALAHREMEAREARQRRYEMAMNTVPMDLRMAVRLNQGPAMVAIANELHQVRLLLERADHDYDGHRAAAVGHISKAINELHPRNHFKDKDTGGNFEPQALSDAQLGEAIQLLANDAMLLTEVHHKAAAAASDHVGNAIQELEIALLIR
jgi:hypothetical protein